MVRLGAVRHDGSQRLLLGRGWRVVDLVRVRRRLVRRLIGQEVESTCLIIVLRALDLLKEVELQLDAFLGVALDN